MNGHFIQPFTDSLRYVSEYVIRQYDSVTFIVITPPIPVVLVTCLVAMTIIPESNNLRTEELMLVHSLRMRKAWRQELVEPER